MANLRGGALPLQPDFTVGPFVSPSSLSRSGHPDGGRIGPFCQMFKLLQDVNQTRGQLECELAHETHELAQRYGDRWIKLDRRHERQQSWMVKQADATFQEVFSQMSLANSSKLLPWCISSAVPLHYMSRVLAFPQVVQFIHPDLHHFQCLLYQKSSL